MWSGELDLSWSKLAFSTWLAAPEFEGFQSRVTCN
jgi:hypothetical protein